MTNSNSGQILSLRLSDHWNTIFSDLHNQSTCDLVFVCEDGSKILSHKIVIFLAVPELYNLISNDGCHQELVIFIPDVKNSTMKHCLECLYKKGDASSLLNILGYRCEEKTTINTVEFVDLLEEVKTEPIMTMITDANDISDDEIDYEIPSSSKETFPIDFEESKEFCQDSSGYIFTNADIDAVDVTNICYDAFLYQLFDHVETARRIVQLYNEKHYYSLIIKSNNSKALRYQCYCGTETKSKNTGIRNIKVKSNYTGCPVKICFYKKANGLVKMTQLDLKHNHELEERSLRGSNKSKGRGFDWDTAADAVVRDGVISNRSVLEMEQIMKDEGISPLPTIGTISRRTTIIKKFFGIFPDMKKSFESKEQEMQWTEETTDNNIEDTD